MILQIIKDITRPIRFYFKKKTYKSNRKTALKEFDNMLFNLHKGNFIEDKIIKTDDFEPKLRIIFKHLVQKGNTVLDIGANVGIHSVYLSKLVGENGKVFAFEPVDYNLKRLNTNLCLNGGGNTVIIDKAVGEINTVMQMNIFKETDFDLGNNSLVENEHISSVDISRFYKKDVNVIKLDDFVEEKKLQIDFIKMDIEGFEYYALKGMKNIIQNQTPPMIIEYNVERINHLGLENEDFIKILDEHYDCYELLSNSFLEKDFALEPFNFNRFVQCDMLCVPKYKELTKC